MLNTSRITPIDIIVQASGLTKEQVDALGPLVQTPGTTKEQWLHFQGGAATVISIQLLPGIRIKVPTSVS